MKRKDFLRKMRGRRRGDEIEERHPERRRAVDWRTLRVDLPSSGTQSGEPQAMTVGKLYLSPGGVRLEATQACWVRGYRLWDAGETLRAEFQYRPVETGSDPPPGSTALAAGQNWQPEG
ncbi:MAG: hypothetical protein ACE5HV_07150 [Acidobacteriota bacterium]